MLFRLLSGALGLFQTIDGLVMISSPERWFMEAPGASATGPFNQHFVIDVGLGFLATGLAFLATAWRPSFQLAAFGASGFVVFHALFHLAHLTMGHSSHAWVDVAIAVPAFLGLALVWPRGKAAA